MSSVKTDTRSLVGTVTLTFAGPASGLPRGQPAGRADDLLLPMAELSALHAAAFVAAAAGPGREYDAATVVECLERAVFDRSEPPAGRSGNEPLSLRAVQTLGAQSLFGFDRSPNAGRRVPRGLRTLPFPSHAACFTRVKYESPYELVITVLLASTTSVAAFTLFVRAIRGAYREIRRFELDDALFDTAIAKLHADRSEDELRNTNAKHLTAQIEALGGIEALNPSSADSSRLDTAQVHIHDE